MILNRRIFDYLGRDECVLEQAPLQRLAAEGQLMAYRHGGFFFAMDTYREYKYWNELSDNREAPWKVWE
jgi:glucose-1-phosphate cytidylyltransferase